MSVSYNATAVIGYEIPVGKLYKTIARDHQEHPVPHGAVFCPVCGKPAVIEEEIPIFDEITESLGEFGIIWATDRKRAFVGLNCSDGGYRKSRYVKIEDLSDLERRLQNVLIPLGLLGESKFGLYAVQYCSY